LSECVFQRQRRVAFFCSVSEIPIYGYDIGLLYIVCLGVKQDFFVYFRIRRIAFEYRSSSSVYSDGEVAYARQFSVAVSFHQYWIFSRFLEYSFETFVDRFFGADILLLEDPFDVVETSEQ